MEAPPGTWHYGVVARWWAEFNVDGPEVEYFRPFVERGQPALDAGCGTGRLLLPYLRAGLDVDGSDVSEDMLAFCRQQAAADRLSPNLYAQAMYELDLPRRYRTIVVCGSFGLGSTREQDLEALRRLHDHLEPDGLLVLDNEVPYSSRSWRFWRKEERGELPRPWPAAGDRRRASDGTDLELRTRLMSVDPLGQRVIVEMRALQWRGDERVADEQHGLTMNLYFTNELALMLERAGFADVRVRAGYADTEPTADDDFVVFIARKANEPSSTG